MPAPERLGRYRLERRLGQGGMATVYRAIDEQLSRPVALKLMHPFLAENREARGRFEREARAVAQLRHPNILAVHDFAPDDAEHPAYLVCELIEGPTLKGFLAAHGAPLPEVAAMIGLQLARALGEAHRHGIVHRDVKPENVMVDRGARIVLCDFGIARLAGDATMTRTGAVIGSPAYMSPEQADGQELDARSDLFSLGTLLYHLSTGSQPFQGREPLAVMSKVFRVEFLPATAKNPRVPPYLERVIARCMKKLPSERWASADEVAAALSAGLTADGFTAIDREIADYFRDPPAYNLSAEERIVTSSLSQARAAADTGEVARGLALCNRVLAWRPDDETARTLVDRIGRRGRAAGWRRRALAAAALAGLAGSALAARQLWWQPHADAAVAMSPRGGAPPGPPAAAPPAAGARPAITIPPPTPSGGPLAPRSTVADPAARPTTLAAPPPRRPLIADRVSATRRPAGGEVRPTASTSGTPASGATSTPGGVAAGAAVTTLVTPPAAPLPAVAEAGTATLPRLGELLLLAQPYCLDGRIDGTTPIDKGRVMRLAPGPHSVRCQGPGGREQRRDVQIVAGERATVELRFFDDVAVRVRLARGDAVQIDGGATIASGSTTRVAVRSTPHEVKLLRGGQPIARAWVDIATGCTLADDPLECRKP